VATVDSLLPSIDFYVQPTYDVRIMGVVDVSRWEHLDVEPSYIDVIIPGRQRAVTNHFQKGKVNILNSNNLDITCTDCKDKLAALPDGMYCITVYVCEGDKFSKQKYYLRTVKAALRLDKILIRLDTSPCSLDTEKLEMYDKANLLLDTAHAHTRYGNVDRAMQLYNQAIEMIEELEDCVDKCK